jgi:transposase-like protein
MKAEDREKHWKEVIGRQEESGLSVRAFCRQQSISEHSVYTWRRRLTEKRPVGFAEVRVRSEPQPSSAALELIFPDGERLQIAAGVDIMTLRTVLAVLRERA